MNVMNKVNSTRHRITASDALHLTLDTSQTHTTQHSAHIVRCADDAHEEEHEVEGAVQHHRRQQDLEHVQVRVPHQHLGERAK